EEIKEKVYSTLGIDRNKKIFLYAPTHKDNVDESFYRLDYKLIKDALTERFGGDWQILVRLHSRLRNVSNEWLMNSPSYVTNATFYEDMQEILVATDVGVTDYSSWIFDYVLLRRPGFIMADSLDLYNESRGFYYPLETTPFPISYSDKELAEKIRNFDDTNYDEKITEFLNARGCYEDGKASERICKKFMELSKK
ncbi:MAG: CDP-glycerol glycerophosphotransferase family protein, partial [Acutalibacteraceae bacterium]